MYMLVDRIPQNIMIEEEGRNAVYDISVARAPFLRANKIIAPKDGKSFLQFRSADFVLKKYDGREYYYRVQQNNLYLLGCYGFFVQGQLIPVDVVYSSPVLVARNPINYNQEIEQSYEASIVFPVEFLHGGLRTQLPVAADSIRIDITYEDYRIVDGFGSLKFNVTYENVFRQWVRSEKNYTFLLKIGNKNWQDFSRYIDVVKLFGSVIDNRIYFYNPNQGMPIAQVKMNPFDRKPEFLEYEIRSFLSEFKKGKQSGRPDIFAFPNPALSVVNIELNQLKPGLYNVVIYNILGQEKFRKSVDVIGDAAIQIDVTNFEKGPYLYGLIDSYGRRIMTKRLTVLKP